MTTAVTFVVSLVLIVAGSELFTNAVEWAGFRMRLGTGATGSLLAAIGTALPETAVPVVALISRHPTSDAVAIGTVVGAPFLLTTLGIAVTGVAVWLRRSRPVLSLEPSQVKRDLGSFATAFWILLVAVVLPQWARAVGAVALLVLYARYVRSTLRSGVPTETMPEPLHFTRWNEDRRGRPHVAVIAVQLLIAMGMLIGGAELFVRGLEELAREVSLSPLILSLVLVPLATELPETLNSVLWVRSRSDGLAFGNVAGAVTFQTCLLGAIGLAFTTWRPGTLGVVNLLMTFATGIYTLVLLRDGRARGWTLTLSAVPWVIYVVLAVASGGHLQPVS